MITYLERCDADKMSVKHQSRVSKMNFQKWPIHFNYCLTAYLPMKHGQTTLTFSRQPALKLSSAGSFVLVCNPLPRLRVWVSGIQACGGRTSRQTASSRYMYVLDRTSIVVVFSIQGYKNSVCKDLRLNLATWLPVAWGVRGRPGHQSSHILKLF